MNKTLPAGGSTAAGDAAPVHPTRTLVLGAVVLVGVAGVLWWTGHALPGPNTYDRQGFVEWLTTTDPIVAAFAVVRLAGMVLIAWTIVSGALGLVVHRSALRRRPRLAGLVDRLCLPAVRRLVHTTAGVALATATLSPGVAFATPAEPARQFATVMALPAETPATPTFAPAPPTVRPTQRVVIVALDAPSSAPRPGPPDTSSAPPAPAPSTSEPASGSDAEPAHPPEPARDQTRDQDRGQGPEDHHGATSRTTWRISAGEHLWHVATVVLTDHFARPPADLEVAAYLTVLVETNRHRLVVPTDPDLVMVGQVFDLPDPTTTGH